MPIPHPCPYPTARPLWIYFANKEKVRVRPWAVSGSLLGLYYSQLLTVWLYRMQILPVISYLHLTVSHPVPLC